LITLTSKQEEQRAALESSSVGLDLTWIAQVDWPEPVGVQYYGFAPVQVDPSITLIPLLEEAPMLESSIDLSAKPKIVFTADRLVLFNEAGEPGSIERVIEEIAPEGTRVTFWTVFIPRDGSAVSTADWVKRQVFVVDRYPKIETTDEGIPKAIFPLIEPAERLMQEDFGRVMSRELFPNATVPEGTLGRVLPRVYGQVVQGDGEADSDCPCFPVDMGAFTRLDGALGADELVIFVESTARFQPTGVLKIDKEKIQYIDRVLGSGTESARFIVAPGGRGYDGTTAVEHAAGRPVRSAIAVYTFFVSDSEISAIGGVAATHGAQTKGRIGGKIVDVEVAIVEVGGVNTTQLILPELPLVEETESAVTPLILDNIGGDWTDSGASNCDSIFPGQDPATVQNDSTAAIDANELYFHTSGALFDPQTKQTEVKGEWIYGKDLAGEPGVFKNAWLVVKYLPLPGESGKLKWQSPRIDIERDPGGGYEPVLSVPLVRPSDEWMAGFLDRKELNVDTFGRDPQTHEIIWSNRPLFEQTNEPRTTRANLFYQSGFAIDRFEEGIGNDKSFAQIESWPGYNGSSVGDEIILPMRSSAQTGEIVDVETNVFETRKLVLKLVQDQLAEDFDKTNLVGFRATIFAPPFLEFNTFRDARFEIAIGGQTFTLQKIIQPDETLEVELFQSGEWTREELLAAEFRAYGRSRSGFFRTIKEVEREIQYFIESLEFEYGVPTKLRGGEEDIRVDAGALTNVGVVGASSLLTQRVNLSASIKSAFGEDPFAFFNGALRTRLVFPQVTAPDRAYVTEVFFEVSRLAVVERQLRDDELELRVDALGVKGLDVEAGSGIRTVVHPQDVIYDFLVNVVGLDAAEVDTDSLLGALDEQQRGWRFGERVDRQGVTKKRMMEELLRAAQVRMVWSGGKEKFVGALTPSIDDSLRTVTELDVDGGVIQEHSDQRDIKNAWNTYFREMYGGAAETRRRLGLVNRRNEGSIQAFGFESTESITLRWVRFTWVAAAWTERKLLETGTRMRTIEEESSPHLSVLEFGDTVTLSHVYANIFSSPGLVEGSAWVGGRALRMKYLVAATRGHWWVNPGDPEQDYIDVFPGTRRIVVVIGGTKVAELEGDGSWRFAGESVFHYYDATVTQSGVVAWNATDSRISFGERQAAAQYGRVMEIDGQGNVYVAVVTGAGDDFPNDDDAPLEDFISSPLGSDDVFFSADGVWTLSIVAKITDGSPPPEWEGNGFAWEIRARECHFGVAL
jgi:hypothetical protein